MESQESRVHKVFRAYQDFKAHREKEELGSVEGVLFILSFNFAI